VGPEGLRERLSKSQGEKLMLPRGSSNVSQSTIGSWYNLLNPLRSAGDVALGNEMRAGKKKKRKSKSC